MMRLLPLSVALFLIVILAFASFPAMADSAAPAPPAPSAVNLTPSQQQKLATLHSESHTQSQALYHQLRQSTEQLYQIYENYNFDVKEARRLNQEINRTQSALLELRLSEQQQLRDILSPDQFALLQAGMHPHGVWDGPGDERPDHDHGHGRGHAPWAAP